MGWKKWVAVGAGTVALGEFVRRKLARANAPRIGVLNLRDSEGAGAFDDGSVLFIGTATTLIRYGGFTILTDPNFLHRGEKVHLGYGLQSTRLTDPALNLEDLPPVDFVVLSHLHEDHFDRRVAAR